MWGGDEGEAYPGAGGRAMYTGRVPSTILCSLLPESRAVVPQPIRFGLIGNVMNVCYGTSLQNRVFQP